MSQRQSYTKKVAREGMNEDEIKPMVFVTLNWSKSTSVE